MRILAIGDPHGDLSKIKKIPIKNIDLILLTGDLGSVNFFRKIAFQKKQGKNTEISNKDFKKASKERDESAIKIIKYLSKKAPLYLIYGNADPTNKYLKQQYKKRKLKITPLRDQVKKIKNTKIIGSKLIKFKNILIAGMDFFREDFWVRTFKPKDNYKKHLKESKTQTKKAKKTLNWFSKHKVDILLTHIPPYKILDKVKSPPAPKEWNNKNAGSKQILNYIKKSTPKYVICGHIHEAKGKKKLNKTTIYNLGEARHTIIEI